MGIGWVCVSATCPASVVLLRLPGNRDVSICLLEIAGLVSCDTHFASGRLHDDVFGPYVTLGIVGVMDGLQGLQAWQHRAEWSGVWPLFQPARAVRRRLPPPIHSITHHVRPPAASRPFTAVPQGMRQLHAHRLCCPAFRSVGAISVGVPAIQTLGGQEEAGAAERIAAPDLYQCTYTWGWPQTLVSLYDVDSTAGSGVRAYHNAMLTAFIRHLIGQHSISPNQDQIPLFPPRPLSNHLRTAWRILVKPPRGQLSRPR